MEAEGGRGEGQESGGMGDVDKGRRLAWGKIRVHRFAGMVKGWGERGKTGMSEVMGGGTFRKLV